MKQYNRNWFARFEYAIKGIIKEILQTGYEKKKQKIEEEYPPCLIVERYDYSTNRNLYVIVSPVMNSLYAEEIEKFVTMVSGKLLQLDDTIEYSRNNFYYVATTSYYPEISNYLKKIGYIEGIDYISALNGSEFRSLHQEKGRGNEWKKVEGLRRLTKKYWEERVYLMSRFIGEDVRSVLDIGCWDEKLKKYLHDSVSYYGCDYLKRQDDTIICDLNNHEFPEVSFDCAFISGNLEYIVDVGWYFDRISIANKEIVMSYSSLEYNPFISERKTEAWVNHLTLNEIITELAQRGFKLETSSSWERNVPILKFRK